MNVAILSVLLFTNVTLPLETWRGDGNVEIEDAYKWAYQATRGGETAAPSRADAAKALDLEWASLEEPFYQEKLIEPLGPAGEIVRLNLRPYKKRGSKEKLLDAFLVSAKAFQSDPAAFVAVWSGLGETVKKVRVGRLSYASWKRLDDQLKPLGYPPAHHSKTYERAYMPAYRVLTSEEAAKLVADLKPEVIVPEHG